ncbi:PREDICTED: IRK-interacting protein isoform X2 [Nelumbo nucifera]|uniref:IRK-interacting protein isoform X2 n=1 Tax=Nelumbo nucifera TaxID=4432 RepID=A0A1U8BHZ0_NELNU|nr:PREDICTED: IRK-interacting protein isoform X2 [Nelumbo nucifera]
MASSSSSISSLSSKASVSPPPPPHHSPLFTPIRENEDEEEEEEQHHHYYNRRTPTSHTTEQNVTSKHQPTPLHHHSMNNNAKPSSRKRPEANDEDDRSVSCNKCRPTSREKISVVPIDINGSNKHPNASPNGLFRSIFLSLTRKSPRSSESSSSTAKEEQWKLVVADLSQKLIQATRKRDEALQEASRLKYSMSELEKKLNKLEIYCHNLKSGLEVCSNSPHLVPKNINPAMVMSAVKGLEHQDSVIESFLSSVSEARSSVRTLSRSLTLQLRQMGCRVYERISALLQPYDVKVSFSKNPRSIMFYLEALLNRAFYEDFESIGFQKSGSERILNPIQKCEANYASFTLLRGLTWDEVLNKGTRHFSEEFSRFCDRKMSEIVAMLGWNRAWPEPLLQAFFGAAKNVWLIHLLACSVHPALPVFRVDKGMRFDGVYMEDMGADKARKLVPAVVRIMVAPGFYVYSNVVKCKVLCRYDNTGQGLSP